MIKARFQPWTRPEIWSGSLQYGVIRAMTEVPSPVRRDEGATVFGGFVKDLTREVAFEIIFRETILNGEGESYSQTQSI